MSSLLILTWTGLSASGTILEEMSSSPPISSPEEDNRTKSYLSVKRASLKKRLRLKTISSKSEPEDTGRINFVNLIEHFISLLDF